MGAAYVDPFELRRLVVKFSRSPSGGIVEDYDAFTVHFAKLTGGAPDAAWATGDYTAVEARFDTWWTAVKGQYPTLMKLSEYRWYNDGPVYAPADRADGPANPAVRITARAVAGTSAATWLPPQVAMTITKICDVRKRWGRIYLPAPFSSALNTDGMIEVSTPTSNVAALVTCFNGCRTDGKQPVVFSRGRSAYVSPKGTAIAAHPATAYEITSLQMDNLFDVMRSRRYSLPTQRVVTALT